MHLDGLLKDRREGVVNRWAELALGVYPQDATGFFKQVKDRFRNPVGHATVDGLGALFQGLLERQPPERMRQILDGIVRIRAVQELSPSRALGFVFLLKQAVHEAIGEEVENSPTPEELSEFEDRIDSLALEAFELYVCCREQLYELRVGEIKRRTSAILQRVNPTEPEPGKGCGA